MSFASALVIQLQIDQALRQEKMFEAAMNKLNRVAEKQDASFRKLEKTINKEAAATDRAADKKNKYASASKVASRATAFLDNAIRRLAQAFALAAVAVTALSVKLATQFEQEMVKIETLVGLNREMVQGWTDDVLEMSVKTGIAAKDLARGLFAITSGGERGTQALKQLEIAAKAAAVGLGDVRDLGRLGAAVLQAYGKELKTDAERTKLFAEAMDTLITAVRLGNIEAHELSTTVGRAIGPAEALGISFQELSGFIATFSRLGVPAAEAVTSLNSTFTTLIRYSEQAAVSLAEYGLSIEDVRKRIEDNGFADTLVFLVNTYKDNVTGLQDVVSNIRALRGVLGTAGAQQENFLRISRMMEASQLATAAAFARQSETAQQAFKEIKTSWQSVLILLGSKTLPILRKIADQMKDAFRSPSLRAAFEDLGDAFASMAEGLPVDWIVRKIKFLIKALTVLVKHAGLVKVAFLTLFGLGVVNMISRMILQVNALTLSLKLLGLSVAAIKWTLITGGLAAFAAVAYGIFANLRNEIAELEAKAEQFAMRMKDNAGFIKDMEAAGEPQLVKQGGKEYLVDPGRAPAALLRQVEERIDSVRRGLEEEASLVANLSRKYKEYIRGFKERLEASEKLGAIDAVNAENLKRSIKHWEDVLANDPQIKVSKARITQLAEQEDKLNDIYYRQLDLEKNLEFEQLDVKVPKGAEKIGKENDEFQKLLLKLTEGIEMEERRTKLIQEGAESYEVSLTNVEMINKAVKEYNRVAKEDKDKQLITPDQEEQLLAAAEALDRIKALNKTILKDRQEMERLEQKLDVANQRAAARTKELDKQIESIKKFGHFSTQAQAELAVLMELGADYARYTAAEIEDLEKKWKESFDKEIVLDFQRQLQSLREELLLMKAELFVLDIPNALISVAEGGSWEDAVKGIGDKVGSIIGLEIQVKLQEKITAALVDAFSARMATQVGAMFGSIIGAAIGFAISYAVQEIMNKEIGTRTAGYLSQGETEGTVALVNASGALRDGADRLMEAASALMGASDAFSALTGIGFEYPNLTVQDLGSDGFQVIGSGDIAGAFEFQIGKGSTATEAIESFLYSWITNIADQFIKGDKSAFGTGVSEELIDTFGSNWRYFMSIAANTLATGWGELIEDLEKGRDILEASMGGVASEINSAMNEMVQMAADGVRLGIDSGVLDDALSNSILDAIASIAGAPEIVRLKGTAKAFEELRDQIKNLGLEAKETASILAQIDLYEEFKSLADIASVFDRLLSFMERASVRNQQVEEDIARVKQAQFQVELKLLQIQLEALDMWTSAMATTFRNLEAWGRNLDNFVNEINATFGLPDEEPDDKKAAQKWRKDQRELIKDWIYAATHSDLEISLRNLQKEFDKYMKLMFVFGEGKEPGPWTEKLIKAFEAYQRKIYMDYFKPLMDFRDQLRDSPTGQTPVRSLLGAKERYEKLLAKALAGDEEAALQLAQAGQEYLSVAEQMYGSSRRFRHIQETILDQIESVLAQWDLDTKSMEEYAEENLDVLNEMLAMMPDELDMLTQIRDVLLGVWEPSNITPPGDLGDRWTGPPVDVTNGIGTVGIGGIPPFTIPPVDYSTRAANANYEAASVEFSEYQASSLLLDQERNNILVDIRDYMAGTYEESTKTPPVEQDARAGVI